MAAGRWRTDRTNGGGQTKNRREENRKNKNKKAGEIWIWIVRHGTGRIYVWGIHTRACRVVSSDGNKAAAQSSSICEEEERGSR